MTRTTLKIFLLILTLTIISCKEELKPDHKVIEVNYEFDNYMRNFRDTSEMFVIKQRNIVTINVDKDGRTRIEKNIIEDSLIVSQLKIYIFPNPENNRMPTTIEKEYQYAGRVIVNKNLLILAKFNKELDYKKYSEIRNKIYSAYNAVRDDFAQELFDMTFYELINSTENNDIMKLNELRQMIPIRYTESVEEK
jgi:hypothetical protein